MTETNIFKLEVNKLKGMVLTEEMTLEEKGEVVNNFMQQFDLNQRQASELLGPGRNTINKWVLSYKRVRSLSPEIMELAKKESDRTKLLLYRIDGQNGNLDKKQKFFLESKKGLSTANQEKLVAVMNGNKTIESWEKEETYRHERIMKLIKRIKVDLLHMTEKNGFR